MALTSVQRVGLGWIMNEVLFYVLLSVAEVIGTIGGFGSSLLVMPLAEHFLGFQQALGLTALFHVFSNVSKIVLFRQGLDRKLAVRMGIPAVVGVVLGALLTGAWEGATLRLALGVVLVVVSVLVLLAGRRPLKATLLNAVLGGAGSGFAAGLVGTGGAVRGVVLAAFALEKSTFIATSAWIDLGVDVSRSVIYGGMGYFSPTLWLQLPVLIVVSYAGTWVGRLLLDRIPQDRFRQGVLLLVFAVGAWVTITSLRALA
jgi:uncharacterized membrane protein YfcA